MKKKPIRNEESAQIEAFKYRHESSQSIWCQSEMTLNHHFSFIRHNINDNKFKTINSLLKPVVNGCKTPIKKIMKIPESNENRFQKLLKFNKDCKNKSHKKITKRALHLPRKLLLLNIRFAP